MGRPSPAGRHLSTSPPRSNRYVLWHVAAILSAALAGAAWFLAAEHEIAGQWGFPLDDSWIYATFARNLARGQGYAFNPGETIGGATGPLYVGILALLFLLFRDVVWPAKIAGLLCLCASSLLVYQTARRILPGRRDVPLLAGLLVALSPPLLWGSLTGLELPFYLLFVCLGTYMYVCEKWTLAVLFWAIGVWLRPDGLFFVLLGVFLRPGISARNTVAPLMTAGFLIAAYFGFNLLVGRHLLPSSVGVKTHLWQNLSGTELAMLKQWADLWGISDPSRVGLHAPLILAGLGVGAFACLRRLPALVAYAVLLPFVFALFGASGGQFDRYIVYIVPVTILLAVVGFDHLARRALRTRALAGMIALGVLCLGWQAYVARKAGIGYGWNVQNINGMQRYVADLTRRATSPGDTVAVNDVGAMGFFSDCYVVDLVGLVSPRRSFPEALKIYRPKCMAIFPDWFEPFAAIDWKTDQVVFYDADSTLKYSPFLGVRLRRNTISSRNTMYLYERMEREKTGIHRVPLVIH